MRFRTPTFSIPAAIVLAACTAQAQDLYKLTRLQEINFSDPSGYAAISDVNNAGTIVGWSGYNLLENQGVSQSGTIAPVPSGWTPTTMSWHYGINNLGDIAGARRTPGSLQTLTPLPTVRVNGIDRNLGTTTGSVYDINDSRVAVGAGGGHGTLWTWNAATDQYTTIVSNHGISVNNRPMINASGQVLASAGGINLLADAGGSYLPLSSSFSFPTGLNDNGDIVGNNNQTQVAGSHGTIRLASGQTIDLSVLAPGRTSMAYGISNSGVVACTLQNPIFGPTSSLPYVWDAQHGFRNLNNMIESNIGLEFPDVVSGIYGMSDDGKILVKIQSTIWFPTSPYYAVLTPLPTPGAACLLASSLCFATRRKRAS